MLINANSNGMSLLDFLYRGVPTPQGLQRISSVQESQSLKIKKAPSSPVLINEYEELEEIGDAIKRNKGFY